MKTIFQDFLREIRFTLSFLIVHIIADPHKTRGMKAQLRQKINEEISKRSPRQIQKIKIKTGK